MAALETSKTETIGGRISRSRDAMNLSTAQLARRLGVKSKTMNSWEADRSEPRANRLMMLAGVLSVSPTWLLDGSGDDPARLGSALHLITGQLEKLKQQQLQINETISAIEGEITSLLRVSEDEG